MSNLAAVKILQDLRANGLDLGFEEADYAAMDTAIEALSAFGVVIGRNTDSDGTDVFIVRTSAGETEYFVRATPASTKKRVDKLRETATPTERTPQRGGDALALAIRFHETYERLAPSFGYETRQETRAFDPTTPNGRLMVAVCGELLPRVTPGSVEALECAPNIRTLDPDKFFHAYTEWFLGKRVAALSASAARSGGDADNGGKSPNAATIAAMEECEARTAQRRCHCCGETLGRCRETYRGEASTTGEVDAVLVPRELPPEVLAECAFAMESGNPKHLWDLILAKLAVRHA